MRMDRTAPRDGACDPGRQSSRTFRAEAPVTQCMAISPAYPFDNLRIDLTVPTP